jgi:acetoin:2,6-dichlorophenolindophenol oxidoreductase subunit alpha
VADLAVRAAGYAFPGVVVEGNDVLAVYEAVVAARVRAVAGDGPTFIEAKTYRQRGHYEGDPMVYRTREEIESWKARDPIPVFRQRLIATGRLYEGELEELQGGVMTALEEAVAFARTAPEPQAEEALKGVYADTHAGLVF